MSGPPSVALNQGHLQDLPPLLPWQGQQGASGLVLMALLLSSDDGGRC